MVVCTWSHSNRVAYDVVWVDVMRFGRKPVLGAWCLVVTLTWVAKSLLGVGTRVAKRRRGRDKASSIDTFGLAWLGWA